jgi:hypothetical protein
VCCATTRARARDALAVRSILTIAFLISIASATRSAEIDSLTGRTVSLADSSDALERRLDQALEAGVLRANQASEDCDEDALYRELRRALATPFIGHVIAEALNQDETLDRRRVRRVDSIYRDLDLLDNVSVHWKDLSAVVRVGDALIGVDKLGHFLVEGWRYFEIAQLEGEGIPAAMEWGERAERTYFGLYTTGVHSYADLVANFEGMRFWMRVLGSADDPLDTGWRSSRPYVTCRRRFWLAGEKRWRFSRKVDLADYATPVWDEAVNCCSYRNQEIEALVRARIAEVSEADQVDYTCPLDRDGCARARQRYGEWAPRLLHPTCLAAPSPARPWWRF